MSDRKCLRFFYDAFENGIESLDARFKGRCQEISFDFGSFPSSKMKEHRFSLPFTSFGREQCFSPMKSFCLKQYFLRGGTY